MGADVLIDSIGREPGSRSVSDRVVARESHDRATPNWQQSAQQTEARGLISGGNNKASRPEVVLSPYGGFRHPRVRMGTVMTMSK